MKARHIFPVSVTVALGLFWAGCADIKSDLPLSVAPGVAAHPPGFTDPASQDFHGNTIRSANWDMRSCQTCHGVQYSGGAVESSCRDCHTGSGGPENCATCHGTDNPAPPRDLNRNTATTARGVGAHQLHVGLYPATISACNECHVVPGPTYDPQHIDASPGAEVTFGGPFGTFVTGRGTNIPHPSYDPVAIRCNNTFCHGDFAARRADADSVDRFAYTDSVMLGARFSPVWTGGAAEAACGTCHGLPPAGHIAPVTVQQCGNSGCHPGIVNANGQISDKTRHMNGRVNVRGIERSF